MPFGNNGPAALSGPVRWCMHEQMVAPQNGRRPRAAPHRSGAGGAVGGCRAGVLLSGQAGGYGGDAADRQPAAPG